jgi:ABC-2 type transport system permease protein
MTPAFMLRVPKSSGWELFTKTVYARAYPRLVGALREKSWIFFEILLPLLAVSAYVFIYRALQAPEQYIGFVVVGGAMTAFWMNILWSMSSQLYWEKEQGNLALYIMAPNSMMAILLGMAVGGLVMTLTRAVVILGLGSWIFNVEYSVSSYWQLALVFTLTMVSLYGLGMMSASVYLLLSREAWHISNLAQEPVFLVSGFYFPVKNLGFWIPLLASIIPLTLGLDAVRQLAIPGGSDSGFLPVPVEAAILLFLSIVFLASARWLLAYMERLAIREGRLTESRR